MFKGTIRKFLANSKSVALTSAFVEVFTASEMTGAVANGVLVYNGSGVPIEVNYNSTDALPWYSIPPGSTFFVPFDSQLESGIWMRGLGVSYKAQMVKL